MSSDWSPEEDAILTEIYSNQQPAKHQMHRLPGRTYPAAKIRARRLGLEFKAPPNDGSLSWIKAAILKELERGIPMSDATLSVRIGASRAGMKPVIRRAHGVELKIADWERAGPHSWRPMWTLGNGPDAPKPLKKSAAQACRDCREKKRREAGRYDPFASLFGAMPTIINSAGRVYKQDMKVHVRDEMETA